MPRNSRISNAAVSVLATAGVVAAAILFNPSAERHRSTIKEMIGERSQLEKMFGVGHLTAFASQYHSIGVASYTTVNGKTRTVGAFGMVFFLAE
jgi:hypothetical protein